MRALADTRLGGRSLGLSLSPAVLVLFMGFVCAALLALPGLTVATKSLDQLFLALDGINRILKGQVPNVDFHTSLGPLVYYVPALGYSLTESFGAALPAAMALFTIVVASLSMQVLASRLRPFLALPFAGFLLLILAAPVKLGDAVTALSFAAFHDRVCWVALALLLAMHLRPLAEHRYKALLDSASAAVLALMMLYSRANYGLVALAFLLLMLADRRQRAWAAASLAIVAVAVALVELLWGGSAGYAADVWRAMQARGALGGGFVPLLQLAMANLADFLLLAVLVGLALWRNWCFRDLLFFLFCALGGLWLLSHNDQRWGIISVHVAALVAAESLLRQMDKHPETAQGTVVNASGVKLYFLAFVLPTLLHCGMALTLHAGAATVRAGQPLALPRIDGVHIADLWTTGDLRGASHYLDTVRDGLALLEKQHQAVQRLTVLGNANVFSTAFDLTPAEGDAADLRWNALADGAELGPADRLLAEVDTVLLRKNDDAAEDLPRGYIAFLGQHFSQIGESRYWILYRRTEAPSLKPLPG